MSAQFAIALAGSRGLAVGTAEGLSEGMRIACLHTAQVHVATFDALFAARGVTGVTHLVRPDLLTRARAKGLVIVAEDLAAELADVPADAVLCTCSTLGPLVDDLARQNKRLIRIDRPLMEAAARSGGKVLLAICLDSTREATLALFDSVAGEGGHTSGRDVLMCDGAWPLFEAGRADDFGQAIADHVRRAVSRDPCIGVIVLAQASMKAAEAHLEGMGLPVLSSPTLGVDRTIAVARSRD